MDKIQMTEEQAERLYADVISEISITTKKAFMNGVRAYSYIKKSELETLVYECEETFKNWDDRGQVYMCHCKLKNLIDFLKKDHPEFKK